MGERATDNSRGHHTETHCSLGDFAGESVPEEIATQTDQMGGQGGGGGVNSQSLTVSGEAVVSHSLPIAAPTAAWHTVAAPPEPYGPATCSDPQTGRCPFRCFAIAHLSIVSAAS